VLHHLPEGRALGARLVKWLMPGSWVMLEEPDFYATWTVEGGRQLEKEGNVSRAVLIDFYDCIEIRATGR
jgi:hypothetical protein